MKQRTIKQRSILLLLCLMAFVLPSQAYDFAVNGIYYLIHDATAKTVFVTYQSYSSGGRYTDESWTSGYSGDVTIPSSVTYNGTTYSVVAIGAHAFDDANVTSVTLPSSITSIKSCAFTYCTNMTSINIPSSVTSINSNAFSNCIKLTSINIPAATTDIGTYAFYGCTGLTDIICSGATPCTITSDVFSTTTYNMATLNVPTGSKSSYQSATGWGSFANISDGDTRVNVLDTNNACSSISFANSGSYGFEWNATSNRLQSTNFNISSSTATTTVTFNTVIASTFSFDYAVSSESGCDKLTVTLDGTTIINAISGTVNSTYSNSSLSTGSHTLVLTYTKDGSVNSGSDRAYISNMQFKSNATAYDFTYGGKYYKIHDALTKRAYLSFQSYYSGGAYTDESWTSGYSGAVTVPSSVTYGSYTYTVTGIGVHAFDNSSVTSVSLPSTITTIKSCAFTYCTNLTSITIPSAVTTIGSNAFSNCSKLTAISLPANVTSIGNYAFYGCTALTSVTSLATTPPTMSANAFSTSTYNTAILNVPSSSTTLYATATGWSSFASLSKADITMGTGTVESSAVPYGNVDRYSTSQSIYTSSEIGGAGTITSISYNVSTASSLATTAVRIYMGHKSSLFSSTSDYMTTSNLTLVYSGTPTIASSTGWETINLTTPFSYNGTDNLVIVVCRQSSNYNTSAKYYTTTMSSSSYCLYRYSDSYSDYGLASNTSYSYSTSTARANIKITKTVGTTVKTIGTGTSSTSNYPYRGGYYYSTTQDLYTAAEVGNAGVIRSIAYNCASTGTNTPTSLKIYMGHKSSTFSSSSDYLTSSNLTLVYSGSPTLASSTGWETINLTTPFTYNGVDNLVVVVCKQASSTNSAMYYYTECSTYNLTRYSSSYSDYGLVSNTSYSYSTTSWRPNTRFTMTVTDIIPTGISLNKTSATIWKGSTLSLTATVTPTTATNKTVTWSSSNTSVATVSSTGVVTAVAKGNATITAATTNGISTTCYIIVKQPVTSITLSSTSKTLVMGETTTITATASPTTANNTSVTWSTTNSSVATVTNGTITPVGPGTCYIRATASDGYGTYNSCYVTVFAKGDVNGSGSITTADVTGAVKFVVGNSTSGLYQAAADYNSNGTVTVTDVLAIARLALTSSTAYTGTTTLARGTTETITPLLSVDEINMTPGQKTDMEIAIADKTDRFTSMQFEVTLPEGVTIESVGCGNCTVDHIVDFYKFEDGTVRVICYSMTDADFTSDEGGTIRLTLKTDKDVEIGSEDIEFNNIYLTHDDVSEIYSPHQTVGVNISNTTGISDIDASTSDDTHRYNTAGQHVNKNAKGVVISSDGKKYMIK